MTAALRVLLLGPVQCRREGAVVPLGGARRSALLALLASRHLHSASRAELVDGLWGDHPPLTAVNSIQVHVSALRRAVGPDAILTQGDGYRLAGHVEVDATDFARHLVRGQDEMARGEAHVAARTLRKALLLWQGPALADVRDAPFAAVEAARLEEMRLAALTSRIAADLTLGRHHDVVPELQALVAQEPLREGLRAALMRALDRCDRKGDALAVYDAGRRLLRDELGIEPSQALRALHHQLLTQPDDEAWRGSAPDGTTRRFLPSLLDETVGRHADVELLEALLATQGARLVSVLGAGGVGKTRLSIELAHRVGPRYRDGVVFVPLAEAEKPTDVAATICSALGVPAADDAERALVSALRHRQMLVICDNFEHIIEARGTLSSLLDAAPDVQVLATSRQPLKVRSERLYRLEPLVSPGASAGASGPAVDLFVLRARAADPSFDPDPHELVTIGAICDRCDGLPLAIELAAARVHALGPAELLTRLKNPLPVLGIDRAEMTERHQTIRASISWSFNCLPAGVRESVPQLSVFHGGFTLAAAGAVTGLDDEQALHCVQTLLDHGLVRRSRDSPDGPRFELLETVRQYARDLVGPDELAVSRDRHAGCYRAVMNPPADPSPTPSTAVAWMALLVERPNIRAAIRWASGKSDGELAADLVIGAATMWRSMGPRDELAGWLAAVLGRTDVSTGRQVDALYATAFLRERAEDIAGLGETLARAQQLASQLGDCRRLAWVTMFSAWHATRAGNRPEAERLSARAARLAEHDPDAYELRAWAKLIQGLVAFETPLAIRHLEDGLRIARSQGLDVTCLVLLANLTERTLVADEPERARRLADEGIPLAMALGAIENAGVLHGLRAYAHLRLGNDEASKQDALAGIRHAVALAGVGFGRHSLVFLAAASAADRPDRAARLLGIADGGRPDVEHPAVLQAIECYLGGLHERLGAAYPPAYDSGRQLVAERGLLGALVVSLAEPWELSTASGTPLAVPNQGAPGVRE